MQMDDDYPFGLTFNSYRRENSTENKFLYNQGSGKKKFNTERVSDLSLNVDMTKFRVYDPALGRWWQVDPLADESDFTSWSPYNYSFNNPVSYNDPYGDTPITPILRKLAQQGVKWAARTVKGGIKPISRKQAVKTLQKKGTVYQVEKGSNKVAKSLVKEAKPGQKIARHDGHKLPDGKKGMDHYQPKAGDGSHVNYMKSATAGAATTGAASEANSGDNSNATSDEATSNMVDNVVEVISNSTPQGAAINQAANAGKAILGDNAVGNFVDNWVNPFGLGKDLMDLTIIGGISIMSEKE